MSEELQIDGGAPGRLQALMGDLRASGLMKAEISIEGQQRTTRFVAWTWEKVAAVLSPLLDKFTLTQRVIVGDPIFQGKTVLVRVDVSVHTVRGEAAAVGTGWGSAMMIAGVEAAITSGVRHVWTIAAALAEPDPLHSRGGDMARQDAADEAEAVEAIADDQTRRAKRAVLDAAIDGMAAAGVEVDIDAATERAAAVWAEHQLDHKQLTRGAVNAACTDAREPF